MYRIGELAKLANVTPDTIRYYEKQQMIDHVA
jgi:Predicted transcriptional regulators